MEQKTKIIMNGIIKIIIGGLIFSLLQYSEKEIKRAYGTSADSLSYLYQPNSAETKFLEEQKQFLKEKTKQTKTFEQELLIEKDENK